MSLRKAGFFIGGNMPTKEQISKYQEVYEAAKRAGATHPEVIAAQWAVESAWGKKASGKNNLFGIKAGNGDPNNNEQGSVIWTTEQIKGKKVKMLQKFRDYDSIDQSIADRIKFTQENPRYRKAGYFDATSPFDAAMSLDKAGYATDKGYGKLLIDVMKSVGVNPLEKRQYDYSTSPPQNVAQKIPEKEMPTQMAQQAFYQAPTQQPTTPQPLSLAEQFASFGNPQTVAKQVQNPLENEPLKAFEPLPNYRKQYQKQLASAFGIEPETQDQLPSHIGDLVKSIYDQTA